MAPVEVDRCVHFCATHVLPPPTHQRHAPHLPIVHRSKRSVPRAAVGSIKSTHVHSASEKALHWGRHKHECTRKSSTLGQARARARVWNIIGTLTSTRASYRHEQRYGHEHSKDEPCRDESEKGHENQLATRSGQAAANRVFFN
jgi:hypothetical protein